MGLTPQDPAAEIHHPKQTQLRLLALGAKFCGQGADPLLRLHCLTKRAQPCKRQEEHSRTVGYSSNGDRTICIQLEKALSLGVKSLFTKVVLLPEAAIVDKSKAIDVRGFAKVCLQNDEASDSTSADFWIRSPALQMRSKTRMWGRAGPSGPSNPFNPPPRISFPVIRSSRKILRRLLEGRPGERTLRTTSSGLWPSAHEIIRSPAKRQGRPDGMGRTADARTSVAAIEVQNGPDMAGLEQMNMEFNCTLALCRAIRAAYSEQASCSC